MSCNVRDNSIKHLKKKGLVDDNMIITNAMFFNENTNLSDLARNKYGVTNQGKLFNWVSLSETRTKAVPNDEMFQELQEKFDEVQLSKDVYYQTQYSLRGAVKIEQNLDKITSLFNKLGNNDTFWNKIQKDYQIPKDQLTLFRESKGVNIQEKLVSFLSNYSYTVEINTGKNKLEKGGWNSIGELSGEEVNSSFYSNLTVPGGTNYTENEIATPDIIPSIKGHAQFATDKGIGWFRSDDRLVQTKREMDEDSKRQLAARNRLRALEGQEPLTELPSSKYISSTGSETTTRRVLEVQSDLFQKGRDKEDLVGTNKVTKATGRNGDFNDKVEFIEGDKNQNQFLQLLNKDNNWVTFFIKSIIQDSSKKGYEKVLFPTGNTASKIEGHETIEEFKKQKEDRIKELEKELSFHNRILNNEFNNVEEIRDELTGYVETVGKTLLNVKTQSNNRKQKIDDEINQLKQELERVEREGFGALKPIYNFYENVVGNILKKQGYKPTLITDEYGNTWQEIEIISERDQASILLQKQGTKQSAVSPEIFQIFEDFPELSKIGNPEQYSQYLDSIFPDSKVKSIVYHGSSKEIKSFNKTDKGIYFSELKNYWEDVTFSLPAIVNSVNPKYGETSFIDENIKNGNNDSIIKTGDFEANFWKQNAEDNEITRKRIKKAENVNIFEIVVFEPEQIHILGSKEDKEGFKKWIRNNNFTIKSKPSSASPKTINLLKDFLSRIGVNVQALSKMTIDGATVGINGLADPMNKLIQYIESKEATVLPEEAMHIVVEILEQIDPKLFNDMFNKISRYEIFPEIFKQYAEVYTKDGKPDVRKIKKEAMGKILAEHLIKANEGSIESEENLSYLRSFWERVVDFLRSLFGKAGYNPFEEAAKQVIEGKIDAEGIELNGDTMFQLTDTQKAIVDKIKETEKSLAKVHVKAENNPLNDTVTDNYYTYNGERVKNRVTDRVKEWYKKKFGNKEFSKDLEYLYEQLRQFGTNAHNDIENIIKDRIDSDGKRKTGTIVRTKPINTSEEVYVKLERYVDELMNRYPQDTVFLSETMIYNPKWKGGEAGTVDFIAILPNGTADVLDWKFMMNKGDDVAWYKQGAYNEQLEAYRQTLTRYYGISAFNRNQFVPFVIDTKFNFNTKQAYISGLTIGSADPAKIEDLRLLPVAAKSQLTSYAQLNEYIKKLQDLYDKISRESVREGRKDLKAKQLNQIMKTIRFLQVQENIGAIADEAVTLSEAIERTVKDYMDNFSKRDPNEITPEEREEMAERLSNASEYAKLYDNIDNVFEDLLDNDDPNAKKVLENFNKAANTARKQQLKVKEALFDFGQKFVADRFNIKNLSTPEKVVNYLVRNFRTFSKAKTKATRLLYNLVSEATQRTEIIADEQNKELAAIKKEYDEWAKAKGLNNKNYYDILFKKRKTKDGKEVVIHKLINEFDSEFYSHFEKAIVEKNKQWFKDNVDLERFKQEAKIRMEKELKELDNTTFFNDSAESKEERKANIIKKYDLDNKNFNGWGTPLMKAFPLQKWRSKEYDELLNNLPALKMYNFIRKINKRAKEAGYITPQQEKTFLPFLRSTVAETMTMGGSTSIASQFIDSISVSEEQLGYGKVDPLTRKAIQSIPKYFTEDLGEPVYDKDGNFEYTDYSKVSRDLFKIMSIYGEQVSRYEEFSKLEQQAKVLSYIENNKGHIVTNKFGTIEKDRGAIQVDNTSNEVNARYYDNFVKAVVYDQAYLDEGFDQKIMKVTGETNKKINKFLGTKVLPEDLGEREVSMVKLIDTTNRLFQLKTLGLNVGTALSNLLGGQFQSIINSGRYFTGKDFHVSELQLASAALSGEEGDKMFALLDYFLPISEITGRQQTQKLGTNTLTSNSFSDFIMGLQRNAEKFIQYTIAQSYIKNLVLIDGKLYNAREYLRSQPEYKDRYSNPADLRRIEAEFPKKVQDLIESNGVMKSVKLNGDKRIENLEGIERLSEQILSHREQIRLTARNATGNLSKEDLNQVRMSVVGRSFMVFKNWIPRLLDQRFGEFTINEGSNQYEWGRARMTIKLLIKDNLKAFPNFINVVQGNEKGVEHLRKLYEEKKAQYLEENGLSEEDWDMSPEEFYDMVRQNIRSMAKDVAFGLILTGLLLAMKNLPDDDEMDYDEKNFYKMSLRYMDKITDEVMFFYKPSSISSIMNGSLFPSLGIMTDGTKIVDNILDEAFGESEKAQPTKYLLKSLPVTKEFVNVIPFISEEWAREMDIRISTESRR